MAETDDRLPMPGFRPEAKILLSVVATCAEGERASRLRGLLQENIDWERLLELSEHNRLTGLLYWHLSRTCRDSVPEAILALLREYFECASRRNMLLTRELIAVLGLFGEHGIPTLPYKGPLLADALYGNVALRHFSDLDILVHKADVLRGKDLLLARGYKAEKPMGAKEEAERLEQEREYIFESANGLVRLEIHWEIHSRIASYGFDADLLWERAVPKSLAGMTMHTIPPEELFIVLCVHGGEKHNWWRLKWIADVARLVETEKDLDWGKIAQHSEALGKERAVSQGLYLANVLLGTPLPDQACRLMRNTREISAFAGLVRGHLFRREFNLPGFKEWLSYVEEMEAPASRNRSVWRIPRYCLRYLRVVTAPDFGERYTLALPAWLSFLYHIYRPLRVLAKHKGGLVGRLR